MRNAGIGAAPENTPMQQAATGGLIALAQGGEVPGYFQGGVPEMGTADYPEEEDEQEYTDEQVDQELESETGHPSMVISFPTTLVTTPRQMQSVSLLTVPSYSSVRRLAVVV